MALKRTRKPRGPAAPLATARRAQAAIFDGIFFLLITSFAISMMFVFLANFGQPQDRVLRTAHVVNYVNSIAKELYFLDASLLAGVTADRGTGAYQATVGGVANAYGGLAGANDGCPSLADFKGSLTVADLLKKDLADGRLDDRFGSEADAPRAPGKTALRCAMKEIMKPFEAAGFRYFAEVLDAANNPTYPTSFGNEAVNQMTPRTSVVTNSRLALDGRVRTCDDVIQFSDQNLVVAAPFRIILAEVEPGRAESVTFLFRLCTWPGTE